MINLSLKGPEELIGLRSGDGNPFQTQEIEHSKVQNMKGVAIAEGSSDDQMYSV